VTTLGQRLRRARLELGITQAEVARRTALRPCAVSHFETGSRRPSLANFVKLCDALEQSADALLGRGEVDE